MDFSRVGSHRNQPYVHDEELEDVPDHDLWLIVTFWAQRSAQFEAWWRALGATKQRRKVADIGVPQQLTSVVASSVCACLAHYSDQVDALRTPPARDGTVKVKPPGGDVGEEVGGLASLLAALVEDYQVSNATDYAQILLPAEDVPARHVELMAQFHHQLRELGVLRRRHGVSDAEVNEIFVGPSNEEMQGPSTGDYTANVMRKVKRAPSWMDPGPGKHVEACRSPSFSITVGARKVAAAATAVILKLTQGGKATTAGDVVWSNGQAPSEQAVADLANCFNLIGSCLITMDNQVLPAHFRAHGVIVAMQTVEDARNVQGLRSARQAISPPVWGLVTGHIFMFVAPAMAVEPFSNALAVMLRLMKSNRAAAEDRHNVITVAALHLGLSTAYIFTGDLRKSEKALTSAIECSPANAPFEPHEDAEWRVRRMGLLQKRAATVTETSARQSFFADATRAVAGLTPDDDSFIPAVFTLAEELSQLDGLNGDAEQGFRYWKLGEAALARQNWLFGSEVARFGQAREEDVGAIPSARKVYASWSNPAMREALLARQRSGRCVAVPPRPGQDMKARVCCAHCGRSDVDATGGDAKLMSKLKRCSRCGFAAYCNAECQKAHWPLHKQTCRALEGAKQASKNLKSETAAKKGEPEN